MSKDTVSNIDLLVLDGPGQINAEATWTGTPSSLAFIINGPGQVGYYARQDGSSPLSVSYDVTSSDFAHGDTWRVTLQSFSTTNLNGEVSFTYP